MLEDGVMGTAGGGEEEVDGQLLAHVLESILGVELVVAEEVALHFPYTLELREDLLGDFPERQLLLTCAPHLNEYMIVEC